MPLHFLLNKFNFLSGELLFFALVADFIMNSIVGQSGIHIHHLLAGMNRTEAAYNLYPYNKGLERKAEYMGTQNAEVVGEKKGK